MTINNFAAGLILGLSVSLTAHAENQPAPSVTPAPSENAAKPGGGIKLKQLSKELGLSSEQENSIKSLFKKHKQKLKEVREQSKDEISETLTPAQKLKLYRLKEKHSDEIKAIKETVKGQSAQP